MYQMKKDLPEKLKPIVDSWKPLENTILYAELKDDGLTTMALGTKRSIIPALNGLVSSIAEECHMSFHDLLRELIDFDIYAKFIGDEDETEENH